MTDIAKLMRQAQEMQEKIAAAQADIEALRVEGQAGAGLVRLTLTGKNGLTGLRIDPSLLKPEDGEIVADLIMAAHEDARRKLETAQSEAIKTAGSAFGGLLPGFKLPF